MPDIDRDPGLQQAEKKLLASLTYEQNRDIKLWFRLEQLLYSIAERQHRLDKQIEYIHDIILGSENSEVNLSEFETACWKTCRKIDARHRKLQLEREVVEERLDTTYDQIQSYESEPAQLTWYLWCKRGYMTGGNDRHSIVFGENDHRASIEWPDPPDQEYDHAIEGVGSPLYDDQHVMVEDPTF